RVPGGLVPTAERLAAERLDQPRHGRDHPAALPDEHDWVADLHARIELLEAVDQRALDDVALEQRDRLALVRGRDGGHQLFAPPVSRSSARLSSSTFTPGSPEKPSPRASVSLAINPSTVASDR